MVLTEWRRRHTWEYILLLLGLLRSFPANFDSMCGGRWEMVEPFVRCKYHMVDPSGPSNTEADVSSVKRVMEACLWGSPLRIMPHRRGEGGGGGVAVAQVGCIQPSGIAVTGRCDDGRRQ